MSLLDRRLLRVCCRFAECCTLCCRSSYIACTLPVAGCVCCALSNVTFAAGGSSSLHSPSRGVEVDCPSRGIGAGMMSKVCNSMDRAKMMGSKVVPTFHKDRKAQASVHCSCTSENSCQTGMISACALTLMLAVQFLAGAQKVNEGFRTKFPLTWPSQLW